MKSRLLEKLLIGSPKSALLLGPRQVGKSTLINSLKPDLSINLADERTFLEFSANPSELRERIRGQKPQTIFIDEIQRHPSLLNTIQAIIDEKPTGHAIKFYLTGSSARKLKRGQANLLPGRIFSFELGPLCAAELGYDLDVARAMRFGTLPEPYLNADDSFAEKLLVTYAGVYLKEEIQAESLTRNLEGFSRFLTVAAESSGDILDFSKLSKLAKIERKNCARFFEILEDTMIAQRLEVFEGTNAEIKKRPKFFFFDCGVLNGLLDNFTASSDRKGKLFENLVISQLLASAKAKDQRIKLYYFRTRAGFEVDLVFQLGGRLYAAEVKAGPVATAEAKKVEQIQKYNLVPEKMFVIGVDAVARQIGDVLICDLNRFLREIGL